MARTREEKEEEEEMNTNERETAEEEGRREEAKTAQKKKTTILYRKKRLLKSKDEKDLSTIPNCECVPISTSTISYHIYSFFNIKRHEKYQLSKSLQ